MRLAPHKLILVEGSAITVCLSAEDVLPSLVIAVIYCQDQVIQSYSAVTTGSSSSIRGFQYKSEVWPSTQENTSREGSFGDKEHLTFFTHLIVRYLSSGNLQGFRCSSVDIKSEWGCRKHMETLFTIVDREGQGLVVGVTCGGDLYIVSHSTMNDSITWMLATTA